MNPTRRVEHSELLDMSRGHLYDIEPLKKPGSRSKEALLASFWLLLDLKDGQTETRSIPTLSPVDLGPHASFPGRRVGSRRHICGAQQASEEFFIQNLGVLGIWWPTGRIIIT